jgi:acyl-coenzyme A thioesterase PaaI-like protein
MKKQPNSRHCFVCGIENPIGLKLNIYELEEGVVETVFTPSEQFQGYPGVLHGGIVASILDEISGRALMGDPSAPRFMFTGKLEIKYRRNVPIGKSLRIIGKALKSKGKIAEGWAGMYDEDNNLLAEATTLLIDVPKATLADTDMEEIGWKVYQD